MRGFTVRLLEIAVKEMFYCAFVRDGRKERFYCVYVRDGCKTEVFVRGGR